MVIVRLARRGAKKQPYFDIVVTDSRNARDGRFIEKLGHFNPVARGEEKKLIADRDRIQHWIGQGAQLSERVAKLLKDFDKGQAA